VRRPPSRPAVQTAPGFADEPPRTCDVPRRPRFVPCSPVGNRKICSWEDTRASADPPRASRQWCEKPLALSPYRPSWCRRPADLVSTPPCVHRLGPRPNRWFSPARPQCPNAGELDLTPNKKNTTGPPVASARPFLTGPPSVQWVPRTRQQTRRKTRCPTGRSRKTAPSRHSTLRPDHTSVRPHAPPTTFQLESRAPSFYTENRARRRPFLGHCTAFACLGPLEEPGSAVGAGDDVDPPRRPVQPLLARAHFRIPPRSNSLAKGESLESRYRVWTCPSSSSPANYHHHPPKPRAVL